MLQKTLKITLIFGLIACLIACRNTGSKRGQKSLEAEDSSFWDIRAEKPASYLYAPGMMGSEIMMGRYCPSYTASTGEQITWKSGGHVIGQPHSAVIFPEIDLRKPTCFTLNPLTALIFGLRKDLFPLAERYFGEKYGITIVDNPKSPYTVVNYGYSFGKANIGQRWDIKTLNKAYQEHIQKFPETDVVLYGDSRGAATIFSFIARHKPEKVKAAIMEGIFDTVPHCIKHFLYDDKDPRAEARLHQILSFVMGKYRKNGINPLQSAELITDDIPLLLVTSLKDGLVAPQCTINLYKRLKERGHTKVHLLVLKKSLHPAYMIDDPQDKQTYEAVVHAFYKQYSLPHNSARAAIGRNAFLATQPSLAEVAKNWPLAHCELCK